MYRIHMDISSQMLLFVKVVELGSFSAVSRTSGQTPSAVSKQISQLEDHVGQRLLHRTRTGVTVSDIGAEFYIKCCALAEKYQDATDHIANFDTEPNGLLRIASSVAFGKFQLIAALPDFLDKYPKITVSIELTDRHVDIEEEQFDAAINFAEQLTDPKMIARKIMRNERVLCASPEFIVQYGTPTSFKDLERFNCLRTSNMVGRNAWTAELDGTTHTVDAFGNFVGNSADAVYKAALAGLGIARLSTYIVSEKFETGELVRLFPDYVQKGADVAVIFAEKRNLSPKIRLFVEFMADRFKTT